MATYSAGEQSTSNAHAFLGLGVPIHLPSLASPNGADTPFLPVPHTSKSIDMLGISDIPPEHQGVDFGSTSYFKYINNDNEVLQKMVLVLQLAPLTAAAGGSNPRYIDDIGFGCIDHIEFDFAGNQLQILYGDEMHFRTLQEADNVERERRRKLQAWQTTKAKRVSLAQNPQFIYVDIPFWWTRADNRAWHQYAFQRLTRIKVVFRQAGYLLQQDGSATAPTPGASSTTYIMNHWLRFHTTAISEATKAIYLKQMQVQGNSGWLSMITDFETLLNQNLAQGTGSNQTFTILLNTFSKYGFNLRYWIRPVANLQPNVLNNNRWAVMDILQDELDISGKQFQVPIDDFYKKFYLHKLAFRGISALPVYNIPLTQFPSVHDHGYGGIEFSNTSNPQLVITTASLPSECALDVYLYCHNYVRKVIKGNQSAAETVQPLS